MTTRTTQSIVRFPRPFWLAGFDSQLPQGEYRVDQEDELVEGLSWTAWRRVGTFIHLPAIGIRSATQHMVPIDQADIDTIDNTETDT